MYCNIGNKYMAFEKSYNYYSIIFFICKIKIFKNIVKNFYKENFVSFLNKELIFFPAKKIFPTKKHQGAHRF